jgi:hypothetical protein
MPDSMPEDMPDKLPEDMSDRMPEDFPVTKRIDVMVGITRSKVFFLSPDREENQEGSRKNQLYIYILYIIYIIYIILYILYIYNIYIYIIYIM